MSEQKDQRQPSEPKASRPYMPGTRWLFDAD
jgi:hypothetical protein